MRNPFDRFSDTEPIGLKVMVAEETAEMRSLFEVYEKFLDLGPQTPADAVYRWSQEQTSSIDLTQILLENFTRHITGLEAMKGVSRTGYLISAMINRLFEDEKLEMTLQINCRVRGLGYRFYRGDLKISGASGDETGALMSGGRLEVVGDGGDFMGFRMSGGRLSVKGNAGIDLGREMSGGAIIVKGSAGISVGRGMTGGEIFISGDVGRFPGFEMTGGKLNIQKPL